MVLAVIIFCVLAYRRYIATVFKLELEYEIDQSKRVSVTKNIIYKHINEKSLLMDVYKPVGLSSESKLPAIVFIHGEGLERAVGNAKEWNIYRSYGKVAASNDFVGVTFNRSHMNLNFQNAHIKKDIFDAVEYIRANADELNIDKDRICIWGYSMGGLYVSLFLKNTPKYIKCLVTYYGLHDIKTRTKKVNKEYESYYPENYLPNGQDNMPPLLIVKAAKDKVKGINQSIDNFIKIAKSRNIKYDYIMHSTGRHSFDALDNNDETKEVINKTLDFIKKNM